MSRTSLETQKLDLMDEVSYLKLKLVGMEETRTDEQPQDPADTEQNKAEVCKGLTAQKVLFFKEISAFFACMKTFHPSSILLKKY